MRVVFRFDVNRQIGSGHLIRSMVLARELFSRGHEVMVLTAEIKPNHLLHIEHIPVILTKDASDGLSELAKLKATEKIDWLVVDSYRLDIKWEKLARKYVESLLVIDDLANRNHDCDLLVDQNINNSLQEKYPGLVNDGCYLAIGLNYLMARKIFYTTIRSEAEGILIFLGGGDNSKDLRLLLRKFELFQDEETLHILITSDYGNQNKLLKKSKFHYYIDLIEPSSLYSRVKLAVVRCGFIVYELALLGVPMVIIYKTEIQKEVAINLEKLGYCVPLNEDDLLLENYLEAAVELAENIRPEPLHRNLTPGFSVVADIMENSFGNQ